MKTIQATLDNVIVLGRIGENECTRVEFDVSGWLEEYPSAVISVLNMRPSDPAAYPIPASKLELTDGKLYWTITNSELSTLGKGGNGQCQIVATVDDVIAKTCIYLTKILPSLDGSGDPPEPWESWVDEILEAGSDATAAKNAAEYAQAKAEDAQHAAEAACDAITEQTATATTLTPGSSATANYADGVLTIGVPKGDKGDKGDTYELTEDDKTDIAEEVAGMFYVNISGTDPTITADVDTRYLCGELYSLNFTPSATGVCSVRFTSGSSPTLLTLPNTVIMPEWWEGVEAGYTYEISIADGVYGVVASWAI